MSPGLVSDGTYALNLPVDTIYPWVVPFVQPASAVDAALLTGTWIAFVNTNNINNGNVENSSNAQNDEIGLDLVLAAGTWKLAMLVNTRANGAIATVNLDGASQGTIDTYTASTTFNVAVTLSFTVATTGKHRVSLKAATRNGSNSTGWQIQVVASQLRRTA